METSPRRSKRKKADEQDGDTASAPITSNAPPPGSERTEAAAKASFASAAEAQIVPDQPSIGGGGDERLTSGMEPTTHHVDTRSPLVIDEVISPQDSVIPIDPTLMENVPQEQPSTSSLPVRASRRYGCIPHLDSMFAVASRFQCENCNFRYE